MNQAPTRKTSKRKTIPQNQNPRKWGLAPFFVLFLPLHKKQIKEESFIRKWGLAPFFSNKYNFCNKVNIFLFPAYLIYSKSLWLRNKSFIISPLEVKENLQKIIIKTTLKGDCT